MRIRALAASSAILITTGVLAPGTAYADIPPATTLYVSNAASSPLGPDTGVGAIVTTTSQSFTTNGSDYTPTGPARILDTRYGVGAAKAKIAAGHVLALKVAGDGAIPATGVTAVVLSLTATDTTGSGNVTAYADGTPTPNVSNLNYTAGRTVANVAIVPVGADGSVDFANGGDYAGSIDLIADVTGYFSRSTASGFTVLSPERLLDTRIGAGAPEAKVDPGKPLALTIAGSPAGDLPASGITAVSLNVTATNTTGSGFVTVYPDGESTPNTSNLNYTPGQTVASAVIVPVGADGQIDLADGGAAAGPIDLVVDVTGFYSAGSDEVYMPVTPTRLVDTRTAGAGPLGPDQALGIVVPALDSSVPDTATAFVLNATVTQPTGSGFIAAYPYPGNAGDTSTVNYTPGLTVANLTQVYAGSGIDWSGGVQFYNGGGFAKTTELIVDIFGYYANP